ncbi:MAG: RNA polymerase sigma factor [Patescibacteria group bacterium]
MWSKISEQQFLEAYDQHADAIFRFCYFRISDREKAKDLAQETFMKSWKYISEGNKIKELKSFLYRVATNLIIDEYRKNKLFSLNDLMERGADPETKDLALQNVNVIFDINKILTKIDQDERDLILMRYIDELSIGEIAKILNQTENNISVKIHRVMAKLKGLNI